MFVGGAKIGWSMKHALFKSPATRNRTRDHLIAATIYSQMLYQLSYSRHVKSMVKIASRNFDFAYFCPLRGAGLPGVPAAPDCQGIPRVQGFGSQVGPRPGAPTPNQFRCASRPQVEAAAGRSITSDFGRPGGLCPNYDLMQILPPPADVLADIQVVGERRGGSSTPPPN